MAIYGDNSNKTYGIVPNPSDSFVGPEAPVISVIQSGAEQYKKYNGSSPSNGSTSVDGSTSSLAKDINAVADYFTIMYNQQQANNAWSAGQARLQREWQERMNAKAMEFNRVEADKNRNWQEMMSNTAHQREIADLKAAGLNPVLSAMNGNGASVTSGATAQGVTSAGAKGDTDTSLNSALVNLLGSVYNRTTQLEIANINARTQEAIADKTQAMNYIISELNNKYKVNSPSTFAGLISRMTKFFGAITAEVVKSGSGRDILNDWVRY